MAFVVLVNTQINKFLV